MPFLLRDDDEALDIADEARDLATRANPDLGLFFAIVLGYVVFIQLFTIGLKVAMVCLDRVAFISSRLCLDQIMVGIVVSGLGYSIKEAIRNDTCGDENLTSYLMVVWSTFGYLYATKFFVQELNFPNLQRSRAAPEVRRIYALCLSAVDMLVGVPALKKLRARQMYVEAKRRMAVRGSIWKQRGVWKSYGDEEEKGSACGGFIRYEKSAQFATGKKQQSSAPSGLIIEVKIPLGKKAGDQLVVAAPDGRQIQIVVPDGVVPGESKVQVQFPAADLEEENRNAAHLMALGRSDVPGKMFPRDLEQASMYFKEVLSRCEQWSAARDDRDQLLPNDLVQKTKTYLAKCTEMIANNSDEDYYAPADPIGARTFNEGDLDGEAATLASAVGPVVASLVWKVTFVFGLLWYVLLGRLFRCWCNRIRILVFNVFNFCGTCALCRSTHATNKGFPGRETLPAGISVTSMVQQAKGAANGIIDGGRPVRHLDLLYFRTDTAATRFASCVSRLSLGNVEGMKNSYAHVGVVIDRRLCWHPDREDFLRFGNTPEGGTLNALRFDADEEEALFVWESTLSGEECPGRESGSCAPRTDNALCKCCSSYAGPLNDGVMNAQTGKPFVGCQLRRLSELAETYNGLNGMEMAWSPLISDPCGKQEGESEEEFEARQQQISTDSIDCFNRLNGSMYNPSFLNLLCAAFPMFRVFRDLVQLVTASLCWGMFGSQLFCSELNAALLSDTGILDAGRPCYATPADPRNFLPMDFVCSKEIGRPVAHLPIPVSLTGSAGNEVLDTSMKLVI
jgi:hypothetical protein